jgi:hypothetical protein
MGYLVLSAFLIAAVAHGGNHASDIRFTRPAERTIPARITEWLTLCRHFDVIPSAFIRADKRTTYMLITNGVKPTGGFGVRVERITRTGRKSLAVQVRFSAPPKGSMVTQQLTWPHDLVVVQDTGWSVSVVPLGSNRSIHVAGLAGIRDLQPITAESPMIKVFSPAPGSGFKRAIRVSGVALVYEGTVQIKVSADGNVVARDFVTSASASHWGYFEKTVDLPDSAGCCSSLLLELFTIDEENGGETNRVQISLRNDGR